MYYGEVTWLGIIVFFIIVIIEHKKEKKSKDYTVSKERIKELEKEAEKTRKTVNDTIEDLKRKGIWYEEDIISRSKKHTEESDDDKKEMDAL